MILADDFRKYMSKAGQGIQPELVRAFMETLEQAVVFIFPADVTRMAEEAVPLVDKVAPFIPFPAKYFWLEWPDPKGSVGILGKAVDSIRYAHCLVVKQISKSEMNVSSAIIDLDNGGLDSVLGEDWNKRVIGTLALLASPDLIEKKPSDLSRLNKARDKAGKPRLIEHETIDMPTVLNLARREAAWEYQREHAGDVDDYAGEPGHRRKHHFVRAHLRFANGKMKLIMPHYRGDPLLGSTVPRYLVRP